MYYYVNIDYAMLKRYKIEFDIEQATNTHKNPLVFQKNW